MARLFEVLESRRMLSAAAIKLSGGTLSVLGTNDQANVISVALDTEDSSRVRVVVNGAAQTFAAAQVRSVRIVGGSRMVNEILSSVAVTTSVVGGRLDDVITVGDGKSNIKSGAGNDTVSAGNGRNVLDSGTGADVVRLGDGDNNIKLGSGDDNLIAGGGNNRVMAGTGNDVVAVGSDTTTGRNTVKGGAGNDSIVGGGGLDRLIGDSGNDTVRGGGGNDQLNGSSGNDLVDGGTGSNSIVGTSGKDTLTAAPRDRTERNAYRVNGSTKIEPAARSNVDSVKKAKNGGGDEFNVRKAIFGF